MDKDHPGCGPAANPTPHKAVGPRWRSGGDPAGRGFAERPPPEAGPEFMQALLQRFRMSYYRFVDESG